MIRLYIYIYPKWVNKAGANQPEGGSVCSKINTYMTVNYIYRFKSKVPIKVENSYTWVCNLNPCKT